MFQSADIQSKHKPNSKKVELNCQKLFSYGLDSKEVNKLQQKVYSQEYSDNNKSLEDLVRGFVVEKAEFNPQYINPNEIIERKQLGGENMKA